MPSHHVEIITPSQGHIYIATADPFDDPIIDPGYFSHSADRVILREGLKLARKLGSTAPLASDANALVEVSPGSSVQSDDDWDSWIANTYSTEFHPSCSCAMLPKELGGVVDADLRVYGTTNVRVVDASVFPIQFAAHMMAPVYGLAERAAMMIRQEWNIPQGTSSNSSSSSPKTPTANMTNASDNHSQSDSAAISAWASPGISVFLILVTLAAII
jgi:choline dehydrogenase